MQLGWLEDSLHGPAGLDSPHGPSGLDSLHGPSGLGGRREGPTLADLAAVGVLYERLPDDDFQGALDRLREARGYVTQDVIELRPDTPNLDGLLAKFKDEHLHRDDEVRFVLEGEGIFDIRGADERWIRVQVERGDLIVVPAMLYHRFFLTERRQIRCVRLFKDAAGWVPEYRA